MIAVVDSNVWGFLAVPVGVVVCLGPALWVWIAREYFAPPGQPRDRDSDIKFYSPACVVWACKED
jgi:hypothetical protein